MEALIATVSFFALVVGWAVLPSAEVREPVAAFGALEEAA